MRPAGIPETKLARHVVRRSAWIVAGCLIAVASVGGTLGIRFLIFMALVGLIDTCRIARREGLAWRTQ